MKVKTSVTLSEDLLKEISGFEKEFENRSGLIEEALRFFVQARLRALRDQKDREILDKKSKTLNGEAQDALLYQVKL